MDPFFQGVTQREIRIRERTAMVPLFYRRLSMMGLTFTVDAVAAQALLPGPEHRLVRLPGGRALAALHCFEYQETGIGPYNEVALTLAVEMGSSSRLPLPPIVRAGRAALRDEYRGFVVDLPVTTEVALAGGVELYNYPKYLADIVFRDEDGERVCRLSDRAGGELILEVRGPRLPCKARAGLHVMAAHSYPVIDGVTRHALFCINQLARAQRVFPRDVAVRLGTHPRAELARCLRPSRPLQYVYVPQGQGILHLPDEAPGGRP